MTLYILYLRMQEENSSRTYGNVLKMIRQRFPEQIKILADSQIHLLDEQNYSQMLRQKSYFIYEQITQSSNSAIKQYRVCLGCFTLIINAYIISLGPIAKEYEQNIYPKYGTQYILFPIHQAQFQCTLLKAVVFKIFRAFFPFTQPTSKDKCKFDFIVDDKYQTAFIPSILVDLQSFFATRKRTTNSQNLPNLNNKQKVFNYVGQQFMTILHFLEYLSIADIISFIVFAEQQKMLNDSPKIDISEKKGQQKYFIYISGLAHAKSPKYYLESEMMQLILNPSFNLLSFYSIIDPIFSYAKKINQTMKSFEHNLLNISFAFSLIQQLNSCLPGANKQLCIMELYENKKYGQLIYKNEKLLANLLTSLYQQLDYDSFSILRDKIIKLCFQKQQITSDQPKDPQKIEGNKKNNLPLLSPSSKIELKKRRSYSQSQKDKEVFSPLNANRFQDDQYFLLKEMKNQSQSSSQTQQWSDSEQRNRNYSEFKEQRELIKQKYYNNRDNEKEKEKEKDNYRKREENGQYEKAKQFQKQFSYLFKKRILNEQKLIVKKQKINNQQKKKFKFSLKAEKIKDRVDFLFQDKKQNPRNIWFYLKIRSEVKLLDKSYNVIEFSAQYSIIFLTLQAHHIIKFCQYFSILSDESNQKHELNGTPLESQNANAFEILNDLILLLIEIVTLKFVKMENTHIDSFDLQIAFYTLKYRKMTEIILLNLRFQVQNKEETIKRLLKLQGEFNGSVESLLTRVKKQELYVQIKYRQFYEGVITSRNLLYQLENEDYYFHLDHLENNIKKTVTLYRDTKELINLISKVIQKKSKSKSYVDICFTNSGMGFQICLKKSSLFLNLLLTDILCFASRFSAYSPVVHQILANSIKEGQLLYNIYYNYTAKLYCNELLFEKTNSQQTQQTLISKGMSINTLYELSIFKNILSWHKSCFFAYKYRTQENSIRQIKMQSVLSNLDFSKISYFWLYNFTLLAIQNSKWNVSDRFLYLLKMNMIFFSSPMLYYRSFIFQVKYYYGESALIRKNEELKWRKIEVSKAKKSVDEQIEHLQMFQDFLNMIKSQTNIESQLNSKMIFSLLHTTFKIFQFREYKLEVEDICIEIVRRGTEEEMKSGCINVLSIMSEFIASFKNYQQVCSLLVDYGNRFLQKVEQIFREEEIEKNAQKMHMYQSIFQYTSDETIQQLKKNNYLQGQLYMQIITFFISEDTFYFIKPAEFESSKSKFRKKEIRKTPRKIDKSISLQLPFQSNRDQKSAKKFGQLEFYKYMKLLNIVCYLRILNGMISKNYGRGSQGISRYMNRYYRTMRKYKIEFCTLQSLYAKVFMDEKNIELEEPDDNKENTQYLKEVYLKTRNENYLLGFVKHIQFLIKISNKQWIELLEKAFQNQNILQDEIIQNYLYYAVSNLPANYEDSLLQKMKQNSYVLFLSIEYLRAHKTTSQNYSKHYELVKQINRQLYSMQDLISPTKKNAIFIKLAYVLTKIYKFFDLSKCIYFYHKYQRSLKNFDVNSMRNSAKFSIYHHLHKLTEDFGGARADFSKPSIKKSLLKNICSKCVHLFNKNLQPVKVSTYLFQKIQKLQYILQISENQKI